MDSVEEDSVFGDSRYGLSKTPVGLTALDGAGDRGTKPRNGNSTGWSEA